MGIGFAAAVALIFILIWESKLVKDITFVQDVPYSIYHYLPDPPKGGIGKLILLGVKVFLLTLVLGSIYLATQQSEMVAEASKAVKPTAANEKGLVLAKYVDNILGYIIGGFILMYIFKFYNSGGESQQTSDTFDMLFILQWVVAVVVLIFMVHHYYAN